MPQKQKLSLIVAMGENGLIGSDGKLPTWKLRKDMGRFVRITKKCGTVIVGRKTWESIPARYRPLSERTAIILTRSPDYKSKGSIVVSSWEEALKGAYELGEEAIVIGGSEIYRLALPDVSVMHITRVEGEFEGDTFFPEYNESEWETWFMMTVEPDEENSHRSFYHVLKRKN